MKSRRHLNALFGVSLALTLLVIAGWAFGVLRSYEQSSVDTRFAIRGVQESTGSRQMLLVGVDAKTFADLEVQWPFPRDMHAQVIDNLAEAGARTIAMDIQFTEPSDDPDADQALADAVGNAGNVVLATEETEPDGDHNVLGGNEVIESLDASVGHTQTEQDQGGVIRRFAIERGGIPTFPVAIAERATGAKAKRDDFRKDGTAWIDFAGPNGSIETVSYSDVLQGKVKDSVIDGKVVVVGATSPSLQDRHRSSTSGDKLMPGPEIMSNSVATILSGYPLNDAGWFLTLLLVLLFGIAVPVGCLRMRPLVAFAVALGVIVAYLGIVFLAFSAGLILPVVYPVLALVLSSIAALAINFLAESYERARTRDVFARFAPDSVVDQVLGDDPDATSLGGKRVEATLLFSDLRGFTTFSEKRDPEDVISILNSYLTEMSDAILDNGGTLVSFMGDGIMAVFGAPVEGPDHAERALAAARDMLARLKEFNKRMIEENPEFEGFKMGIGLNSGWVMSGNVGSERRLEYTAIGDTTNTAARLEGATKGTPYQLFMADSTLGHLVKRPDDFEFVEEMPIRGRQDGVRVWGLVEPAKATQPVG